MWLLYTSFCEKVLVFGPGIGITSCGNIGIGNCKGSWLGSG